MEERVKLIWDFRGPNAEHTAAHHAIHLGEFTTTEGIPHTLHGSQMLTEMHHIAYLVVEKKWMNDLRERLKPTRGQLYTEV